MEHALIALVSLSVTLTIYFDRVHRKDMRTGFARIDKQFDAVDKQFEQVQLQIDKRFEQVQRQIKQVNKQVQRQIKQVNESIGALNVSVVELARGVGRAEGRTEVLATAE